MTDLFKNCTVELRFLFALVLLTTTFLDSTMQSLDLIEAAEFLKMNAEVLRRHAKAGKVPSRKTGKRWVFILEHLAEWVSGSYASHGRELRVIDGFKHTHEDRKCQSTSAKKRGGSNSPRQTADEYSNLLGLK